MKLLLVDLDGTVREPILGDKFINNPLDQKLIDGVEDALSRYQDWVIVGVTNQGGVASGHKSIDSCFEEQIQTMKLLPQLNMILFCPDAGKTCGRIVRHNETFFENLHTNKTMPIEGVRGYRKPSPGMIDYAFQYYTSGAYSFAREKFGENVNITKSLMVGDRPEDEAAALAANVPFMWAEEWREDKNV